MIDRYIPTIEHEPPQHEMQQTVLKLLEGMPLHNDICHRKAVSVAKKILEKAHEIENKYGISLIHLTGHSVTCMTDLSTQLKMIINTGFPFDKIPDDFYFFSKDSPHSVFGNPNAPQLESIFLKTASDVDNAMAWSIIEAKRNSRYYPE